MKSSLHPIIPFLPLLLTQLLLPSPELDPILDNNSLKRPSLSLYNPSHGKRRKHSLFVVEKACLMIRCLEMDVLLLRAYALAGMCLPSRCLAMGLYVTIYTITTWQNIYFLKQNGYVPSDLTFKYISFYPHYCGTHDEQRLSAYTE
jgi:hypothetical protein